MFSRLMKTTISTVKTGRIYGALLCLALFSAASHSQVKAPAALESLKAAFPPTPYTRLDAKGVPYGYTPALTSTIAERMGLNIEIEVMPYLRILHALKMGQIDIGFELRVQGSPVHLPAGLIAASEPQLIIPISIYALPGREIHIENFGQIDNYRVGTIRLETKEQRPSRLIQTIEYHYEDAYSLGKALQAQRIDLVALDIGSAEAMAQALELPLERIYDYSHMEIFPIFSNASPRMKNPLTLCQRFAEARVEIDKDGSYEKLLIDTKMEHLRPYYNQVDVRPDHCRTTR